MEKEIFDISDKWNFHVKRFLISLSLFVAAFLMVMAWIFHLNWQKKISFSTAFGISIVFVIFEFLLNTFITRYAINKKLFTQAQLATLSIVFGVFFIFIVGFFLKSHISDTNINISPFDISGLLLITIGAILVLHK